ncbi:MAG TPA: GNAT family N-acetyltransferase [Verrucomicrobiae bacterium]|nr:GNAT family N-acetyltransferase [Verrucomicrobiae bacterium]
MSTADSEACEFLPWDTEFFGCRIARVRGDTLTAQTVAQVDNWSRCHRIQGLYFLSCSNDPASVRTAEQHGFQLVDVRLTFERALGGESIPGPESRSAGTRIRTFQPADVPALQALARAAHRDTRFFCDKHFSSDRAQDLYSTWITLESQGRAAIVFVATVAPDRAVGYISCHLDEARREGRIGLVGVDAAVHGRGIGQSLVYAALNWFSGKHMSAATVVTQGRNRSAQRLYQRCGFLTRDLKLWYHKWYSN